MLRDSRISDLALACCRDGADQVHFLGIDVSMEALYLAQDNLLEHCPQLKHNVELVCAEYLHGMKEARLRCSSGPTAACVAGVKAGCPSASREAVCRPCQPPLLSPIDCTSRRPGTHPKVPICQSECQQSLPCSRLFQPLPLCLTMLCFQGHQGGQC